MYYGNPSATASQSGEKTFEFFDDFDDGTIDPAKWDQVIQGTGGTITETGGAAVLAPTASTISSANLRSTATFTNNVVFEMRKKQASNGNYMDFSFGSGAITTSAHDTNWWHSVIDTGYFLYFQTSSGNGLQRLPPSGASVILTTSNFALDTSTYKVHKMTYSSSGSISWSIDGVSQTSATDSTYLSNNKKILISQGQHTSNGGKNQSVDYIFAHKYSSADPATSASAEETGPGPVAYWKFDEGQGTTAADATVNHNDGNLGVGSSAPTWKPESDCMAGKCLYFDGSGDYVDVNDINY